MTSLAARLAAPLSRLPRPRPTARLRLTLLYGSLFTVAGAGLLGFTYWLFDRGTNGGKRILPTPPPGRGISCLPSDHRCLQLARAWVAQHGFDLHTLLTQSGIALAVMAAFAFALGWLVAGRVLRPVRVITATARADLRHQPARTARPDRARRRIQANSPAPSTTCWPDWKPPSPPSGTSSPTPPTNCAPRSPSIAPCCN